MSNALADLSSAARQLSDCLVGHTIEYHERVDSTMRVARALAQNGPVQSGTVIIADEQSAGQGRHGRPWNAPPGTALLSTTILTRPYLPGQATELSMLAAVATAQAIEACCKHTTVRVHIKWPNDILLTTDALGTGKVAGVLVESMFKGARMQHAFLGIGINVNQTADALPQDPAALPAVSLRMVLGQPLDRATFLVMLCRALDALTQEIATGDQGPQARGSRIFQLWRRRLSTLNQHVTLRRYDTDLTALTGVAVDVDPEGHLIVRDAAGTSHKFAAGDVTVRPIVL